METLNLQLVLCLHWQCSYLDSGLARLITSALKALCSWGHKCLEDYGGPLASEEDLYELEKIPLTECLAGL